MSSRIKVIVSMLVVILLVAAVPTTIVLAQEEESAPALQEGATPPFLAKVAEILGISTDNLTTAFQQAQQEMREECQATGNCTILRERVMFRNQWKEKRQEWIEKRQEIGKRFQCNGTENQQNMRLRISQSVRGRHMIAVPRGWNGPIPSQQVD